MNEYPTVRYIFDRRRKADSTTPGSVEIEVSFKRKRKWFSTGVTVMHYNWHPQMLVTGVVDSFEQNKKLRDLMTKITDYVQLLILNNRKFTWEDFEAYFDNRRARELSFIDYMKEVLNARIDIADTTRNNHKCFINVLTRYGKIVHFEDLTANAIERFTRWLSLECKCEQSSIVAYNRLLKYYVRQALNNELIAKDPYRNLKIERPKTAARKYLTPDELKRIEKHNPKGKGLLKARDLFLFQCYTGLAYADVMEFDWSKVICRGNRYIYQSRRHKTNTDFYIVVMSKGIEILKKYEMKLPKFGIQYYVSLLHKIERELGFEKKLTSHVARHTFASLCLNNDVRIEVLAKMLGHTDVKTTQIYAKMFNSTVDKAFDHLEQQLFSGNSKSSGETEREAE